MIRSSSKLQQLRHRLDVPVGVLGLGVTQIGRQLEHLARRVLARAIPADHRPGGEAVAQVVDARAAAMPPVALRGPQPELLADEREVVARAAVAHAGAPIAHEEGLRREAEQPVPLAT